MGDGCGASDYEGTVIRRIVNLCSLNGVNAHMGTVEYNSAKEALRSATRTAAREWAPLGITANIICPAAKSASLGL